MVRIQLEAPPTAPPSGPATSSRQAERPEGAGGGPTAPATTLGATLSVSDTAAHIESAAEVDLTLLTARSRFRSALAGRRFDEAEQIIGLLTETGGHEVWLRDAERRLHRARETEDDGPMR